MCLGLKSCTVDTECHPMFSKELPAFLLGFYVQEKSQEYYLVKNTTLKIFTDSFGDSGN